MEVQDPLITDFTICVKYGYIYTSKQQKDISYSYKMYLTFTTENNSTDIFN